MRKPLSKRSAFIGAIVFSAVLVVILFNIAKGVISGETFDELLDERFCLGRSYDVSSSSVSEDGREREERFEDPLADVPVSGSPSKRSSSLSFFAIRRFC